MTDLDTTPPDLNFSTFDGQIGFTSSWNASGTSGLFIIEATATGGAMPTTMQCGYNVHFTVPAGAFLTITPHATTNDLNGVLWIQNATGGLMYSTSADPRKPSIDYATGVYTSGDWNIFGELTAELGSDGTGGLRQFGMDVAVVPEPTMLAAVGLLAPLVRRRRR